MKFRVNREAMSNAVSWTARSLALKPTTPILSGIFFVVENEMVNISSFDYEISANTSFSAEVDVSGKFLVNGRLLADICKTLSGDSIEISFQNNKIILICGSSKFEIATMPFSDYPKIPQVNKIVGTISGEDLAKAINQTYVATSREDTLPILSGMKLEINSKNISILSTDRYRLASNNIYWKGNENFFDRNILIKGKTLNEISKTLCNFGDVNILFSEDSDKEIIGFESQGKKITSLLLDGEYPKVTSLFPENTPSYCIVEKNLLIDSVRRVSVVAEKNTPIILNIFENKIVLKVDSGDNAQASEEIFAKFFGNEDIKIAFNTQYILEGLNAISEKFVKLSLVDNNKPTLLTGQEENSDVDNKNYRYLIMPVRM